MASKLKQVSFLSVFAMILVVIGHSDITLDFKNLWIFKWAYTFHMPLFFLISGFLFAYTNPKGAVLNYKAFIIKKTKRLLVPYIFVSSIIFIIKSLLINTEQMQHPLSFSLHSYFDMLFIHSVGFTWFLPALFVTFLIFLLLRKLFYNKYLQYAGLIICFAFNLINPQILFFRIGDAIYYSVFFALGIIYCNNKLSIDLFLKRYMDIICPLSLILSMLLIPIPFIAAMFGIIFSVTLSIAIEYFCTQRIISVSNFTYTIFLLSYFPQMLIRGPIAHTFPDVNQYVFSTISFLTGFFVPILIGMVITNFRNYKIAKIFAPLIGL